MEFYKISAMVKVPEEDIEAVVPADGSAQKRFMKAAREKGKYYRVASNHSSVMTLIITDRGDIYGAPYLPQTYAKRLTPGTCLLRTDCGGYIVAEKAVQVVSSPNASFKRKFKECKVREKANLHLSCHGIGNALRMSRSERVIFRALTQKLSQAAAKPGFCSQCFSNKERGDNICRKGFIQDVL